MLCTWLLIFNGTHRANKNRFVWNGWSHLKCWLPQAVFVFNLELLASMNLQVEGTLNAFIDVTVCAVAYKDGFSQFVSCFLVVRDREKAGVFRM